MTQQNAAMAEQSTAASQSLSQEAVRLTNLVGQFQVGQTDRATAEKHAPAASRPALRTAAAKAEPKAPSAVAASVARTAPARHAAPALRKPEPAVAEEGWQDF
jgi:methyl-accepting chemotaxis protein